MRNLVFTLAAIVALAAGAVLAIVFVTRAPPGEPGPEHVLPGTARAAGVPAAAAGRAVTPSAVTSAPMGAPAARPGAPARRTVVRGPPIIPLPSDPDERQDALVQLRRHRQANMMEWLNRRRGR